MMRPLRMALLVLLLAASTSAVVHGYRQRQKELVRPAELFDVVWQQVIAFQADDYNTAYQQVSLGFQERFDKEAFTDLVRSDYPPLRLAQRAEFGAVRWDGREAVVPAYFFLPGREVIQCFFSLVQEGGTWKIDKVRVMKRWKPTQRIGGLRT